MVSKANNMGVDTTQLHSVLSWVSTLWLGDYMISPRIEHFAFDLQDRMK